MSAQIGENHDRAALYTIVGTGATSIFAGRQKAPCAGFIKKTLRFGVGTVGSYNTVRRASLADL
jgi:hypothetical protein